MAKSALRIRFVFNHQGGGGATERTGRQREMQKFAGTVVEDLTFRYTDKLYHELAEKIQTQFKQDVRKELVHMAALFRAHIIGAPGSTTGPAGTLTSVAPGAESMPIKETIPAWAPRSPQYLKYKQRDYHHKKWFDRNGVMKEHSNADAWIEAFGPIKVTFARATAKSAAANVAGISPGRVFKTGDGHFKVAVGTIKVFALSEITPGMLPALAAGEPVGMGSLADTGNEALVKLFGDKSPMAYRLGRRSSKETGEKYRPTLEPFLAYFLTSAVPAAVANRLQLNALSPGRSSAGRTRGKN